MMLAWPEDGSPALLWGHLLLIWTVCTYAVLPLDPTWDRTTTGAVTKGRFFLSSAVLLVAPVLLMDRFSVRALLLGVLGVLIVAVLDRARRTLACVRFGAEVELGTAAAYVIASALCIGNAANLRFQLLKLPLPDRRIFCMLFGGALFVWLVRGGTHIVRAILANASALPQKVQSDEFNRGRLIGDIERVVLAAMVAAGAYEALAFLIAAKGLIRSKDLESHEYAEYFIIGTLASTALALFAGGILRMIVLNIW